MTNVDTTTLTPELLARDTLEQATHEREQEHLTTSGQRKINFIWETTQAVIAIMVTLANMIVTIYIAITGHGELSAVLSNAFFLIVGFYFSRTNHSAIGGIGRKPESTYTGR